MNKIEFTLELSKQLLGLPEDEIKEKVLFYVEMIDDRMDEGMSEHDAVADVGSPEEIAEEIISEFPLKKFVKEKIRPKRRLKGWEIALIAVGSPIWISLPINFFSPVAGSRVNATPVPQSSPMLPNAIA